jgi:hypothetical protein
MSANNHRGYIFILQEREFINSNRPIYKVGKTKQVNLNHMKKYSKGSILLFQILCDDCDLKAKTLRNILLNKYTQHYEIGCNYFEGNSNDMANDIFSIV